MPTGGDRGLVVWVASTAALAPGFSHQSPISMLSRGGSFSLWERKPEGQLCRVLKSSLTHLSVMTVAMPRRDLSDRLGVCSPF